MGSMQKKWGILTQIKYRLEELITLTKEIHEHTRSSRITPRGPIQEPQDGDTLHTGLAEGERLPRGEVATPNP